MNYRGIKMYKILWNYIKIGTISLTSPPSNASLCFTRILLLNLYRNQILHIFENTIFITVQFLFFMRISVNPCSYSYIYAHYFGFLSDLNLTHQFQVSILLEHFFLSITYMVEYQFIVGIFSRYFSTLWNFYVKRYNL